MERPDIYRLFGCSPEVESSWEEHLGDLHSQFILAYLQKTQEAEEAAIAQFHAGRGIN